MVARRAHQRVGIVDAAAEHGRHGHPGAAGREQRDFVRAAPDRRLRPGINAAHLAEFLNVFNVTTRMDAGQILHRHRLRFDANEMTGKTADMQQAVQPSFRSRRLGVLSRFDEAVGRQHLGAGARIVPEIMLVKDVAGCHDAVSCFRYEV